MQCWKKTWGYLIVVLVLCVYLNNYGKNIYFAWASHYSIGCNLWLDVDIIFCLLTNDVYVQPYCNRRLHLITIVHLFVYTFKSVLTSIIFVFNDFYMWNRVACRLVSYTFPRRRKVVSWFWKKCKPEIFKSSCCPFSMLGYNLMGG